MEDKAHTDAGRRDAVVEMLRDALAEVREEGASLRAVLSALRDDVEALLASDGEMDRSTRAAHILLAEDDDPVAALIRHRLERVGLAVSRCTNGEDVPVELQRGVVDLLIIEARLPGLNGFDVLRRLRKQDRHHETPVIVLSWPGNEQEVVQAFELGADDFILKPFSPIELTARVLRLVRRRSEAGAIDGS